MSKKLLKRINRNRNAMMKKDAHTLNVERAIFIGTLV